MTLAALVFGSPEWRWIVVGVIVAAGLLVLYSASAYRRGPRWSYLPALLKLLALLLIAVCLTEPLWSSVRTRPGANLFLILADNSASLKIRDAGDHRSGDTARSGRPVTTR